VSGAMNLYIALVRKMKDMKGHNEMGQNCINWARI